VHHPICGNRRIRQLFVQTALDSIISATKPGKSESSHVFIASKLYLGIFLLWNEMRIEMRLGTRELRHKHEQKSHIIFVSIKSG
jgi:hypothetical protein